VLIIEVLLAHDLLNSRTSAQIVSDI